MKKLLFVIALFCLPSVALTGCGGSGENKIIEDGEVEGAMTEAQMSDYEQQMRSGAGSSRPGN